MSTDDNQQPKPGWEWYQPTTVSGLVELVSGGSGGDLKAGLSLPASLAQHVHHLGLEHRVDSLNGDAGTGLWHGEDVHNLDGVVVDELAQHQTHDLHRNTSAAVAQHLEEGERGDVDSLGVVDNVRVL